jgi:hypothetical protein
MGSSPVAMAADSLPEERRFAAPRWGLFCIWIAGRSRNGLP